MDAPTNFQSIKNISQNKSDFLGTIASSICLVHCLATPFIFVAEASMHHHHHGDSPFWWQMIDLAFLIISFAAVYWSAKNSSRKWMKSALYASWIALAFILVNEKLALFHLMEELIYLPAIGLIGLHLYNRKYCQCADETCCANPK
ncbi:MerC domain-containing protein [Flammeovirgaceae bacterium SG7u.111]|nr:MerC domain-containing protein [Flammeovirgaceae bacterium SG7u.132]WPO36686.1 MerC domain-containing protein [Flammeovirgaceae bacterium SG7u.111]